MIFGLGVILSDIIIYLFIISSLSSLRGVQKIRKPFTINFVKSTVDSWSLEKLLERVVNQKDAIRMF